MSSNEYSNASSIRHAENLHFPQTTSQLDPPPPFTSSHQPHHAKQQISLRTAQTNPDPSYLLPTHHQSLTSPPFSQNSTKSASLHAQSAHNPATSSQHAPGSNFLAKQPSLPQPKLKSHHTPFPEPPSGINISEIIQSLPVEPIQLQQLHSTLLQLAQSSQHSLSPRSTFVLHTLEHRLLDLQHQQQTQENGSFMTNHHLPSQSTSHSSHMDHSHPTAHYPHPPPQPHTSPSQEQHIQDVPPNQPFPPSHQPTPHFHRTQPPPHPTSHNFHLPSSQFTQISQHPMIASPFDHFPSLPPLPNLKNHNNLDNEVVSSFLAIYPEALSQKQIGGLYNHWILVNPAFPSISTPTLLQGPQVECQPDQKQFQNDNHHRELPQQRTHISEDCQYTSAISQQAGIEQSSDYDHHQSFLQTNRNISLNQMQHSPQHKDGELSKAFQLSKIPQPTETPHNTPYQPPSYSQQQHPLLLKAIIASELAYYNTMMQKASPGKASSGKFKTQTSIERPIGTAQIRALKQSSHLRSIAMLFFAKILPAQSHHAKQLRKRQRSQGGSKATPNVHSNLNNNAQGLNASTITPSRDLSTLFAQGIDATLNRNQSASLSYLNPFAQLPSQPPYRLTVPAQHTKIDLFTIPPSPTQGTPPSSSATHRTTSLAHNSALLPVSVSPHNVSSSTNPHIKDNASSLFPTLHKPCSTSSQPLSSVSSDPVLLMLHQNESAITVGTMECTTATTTGTIESHTCSVSSTAIPSIPPRDMNDGLGNGDHLTVRTLHLDHPLPLPRLQQPSVPTMSKETITAVGPGNYSDPRSSNPQQFNQKFPQRAPKHHSMLCNKHDILNAINLIDLYTVDALAQLKSKK